MAKNGFKSTNYRGLAVAKVLVEHRPMARLRQNGCGGPNAATAASEKDALALQLGRPARESLIVILDGLTVLLILLTWSAYQIPSLGVRAL